MRAHEVLEQLERGAVADLQLELAGLVAERSSVWVVRPGPAGGATAQLATLACLLVLDSPGTWLRCAAHSRPAAEPHRAPSGGCGTVLEGMPCPMSVTALPLPPRRRMELHEVRAAESLQRWYVLLKTTRDGGAPDASAALQAATQAEDAGAQAAHEVLHRNQPTCTCYLLSRLTELTD